MLCNRASSHSVIGRMLLVCGLLLAAPPMIAAGQIVGYAVTVTDVDGENHRGRLRAISDAKLSLDGSKPPEFDTSDLFQAEFKSKRTRPASRSSLLLLENGDRIVIRPVSLDDQRVVARWFDFPDWSAVVIPLETIRGIVLVVPETPSALNQIIKLLLDRREKGDVLILNNGDHVIGELQALDRQSLTLQAAVGKTKTRIRRSGVQAIGFDPSLTSFPKVTGKLSHLMLTDGTRLTARNLRLASKGLLCLDAVFGAKLEVPFSAIVSIRFLGGRTVYLSDLKPSEYRFTPFLSTHWLLRGDRNVNGGPLQLRGREYVKGLGLHSQSTVTYSLDGHYRRFHATIGIDDAARGRGSVIFAVELDGRRVFSSDLLTGKSPAVPIKPIDVTGKRRLTLIVDYGQFGDIQDLADWCDAVLIK